MRFKTNWYVVSCLRGVPDLEIIVLVVVQRSEAAKQNFRLTKNVLEKKLRKTSKWSANFQSVLFGNELALPDRNNEMRGLILSHGPFSMQQFKQFSSQKQNFGPEKTSLKIYFFSKRLFIKGVVRTNSFWLNIVPKGEGASRFRFFLSARADPPLSGWTMADLPLLDWTRADSLLLAWTETDSPRPLLPVKGLQGMSQSIH